MPKSRMSVSMDSKLKEQVTKSGLNLSGFVSRKLLEKFQGPKQRERIVKLIDGVCTCGKCKEFYEPSEITVIFIDAPLISDLKQNKDSNVFTQEQKDNLKPFLTFLCPRCYHSDNMKAGGILTSKWAQNNITMPQQINGQTFIDNALAQMDTLDFIENKQGGTQDTNTEKSNSTIGHQE